MEAEHRALLRQLLTERRLLSLAVVADGRPVVGLLPFAVTEDFGALIVHASRLARHAAGLRDGAPFDVLIHAGEEAAGDPLAVPRVTLQGHVCFLAPERPEAEAARTLYLARLPSAESVLTLGGFRFYRLELEEGRLVAGFAQALNLSRDSLAELRSPD